jgi:hypothetical protein
LLSSYGVARLLLSRLIFASWGLDAELVVHLLVVPLAQLAAFVIRCRLPATANRPVLGFVLDWLHLTVPLALLTPLTSWLLFHHVDLRYEAFHLLLVVPTCQALIVGWVVRDWQLSALVAVIREVGRQPLAVALLIADMLILIAGWTLHSRAIVGLAGEPSLHPGWIGVKSLGAAVLLVVWSGSAVGYRAVAAALALLAAVLGSHALVPWLDNLTALVPQIQLLRWLAVYGILYLVATCAVLVAAHVLRESRRAAATLLDGAAAIGLFVALVTALSLFNRPYLIEPWRSLVISALSIASAWTLAATILLVRPTTSAEPPG